jgi:hypothetical protein
VIRPAPLSTSTASSPISPNKRRADDAKPAGLGKFVKKFAANDPSSGASRPLPFSTTLANSSGSSTVGGEELAIAKPKAASSLPLTSTARVQQPTSTQASGNRGVAKGAQAEGRVGGGGAPSSTPRQRAGLTAPVNLTPPTNVRPAAPHRQQAYQGSVGGAGGTTSHGQAGRTIAEGSVGGGGPTHALTHEMSKLSTTLTESTTAALASSARPSAVEDSGDESESGPGSFSDAGSTDRPGSTVLMVARTIQVLPGFLLSHSKAYPRKDSGSYVDFAWPYVTKTGALAPKLRITDGAKVCHEAGSHGYYRWPVDVGEIERFRRAVEMQLTLFKTRNDSVRTSAMAFWETYGWPIFAACRSPSSRHSSGALALSQEP